MSTVKNSTETPTQGGLQAWFVWGLAVCFVLYLFGFQTGYSVTNRSIADDISLSVAQVGLIAAVYTWSFAFFQLFSGALLDRLGARRVLLPAIALMTGGVFVFAQASSFSTLILAQLILALGACAGFVGAGYIGGQWFGMAKFSFMFGLVQCFASLFSAFNQNLLVAALEYCHWRSLFNYVGGIGIILFALCLLFLRNPVTFSAPRSSESLGKFAISVLSDIFKVAKIPQVWLASGFGSLIFGALLSAGVVWAPKLMMLRGLPEQSANFASSILWIGLAVGCIVFPWASDKIRRRKLPVLAGILVQLAALFILAYGTHLSSGMVMILWFFFGLGAAAHMLAFSAAGDAVQLEQIGTSAAIVNGTMFLVSGALIARPGTIASHLVAAGTPISLGLAQSSLRPLLLGLVVALVLALCIRESHPRRDVE